MANHNKWTFHHLVVFLLTFFSFSCFHATRKAFSNVKDAMQKEWTNNSITLDPPQLWENRDFFRDEHHAEVFLGAMDTTFLLAYAVGLYISGILGDRFNLRKVLAFGMCSSAIMVFMFGTVSKWIGVYNIWYYGVFMALNGLLQSTGWPCVVAVMGNWFGKSSRGIVFGLWSANASVGNIFGALQVAALLDYGYEYAMLVPAAVSFAFGIVIFFCLVPSPDLIGLPMPEEENQSSQASNIGLPMPEEENQSSQASNIGLPMPEEENQSSQASNIGLPMPEEENQSSQASNIVFSDDHSAVEQEAFANKAPEGFSATLSTSSVASHHAVKPKQKKAITFCQAVFLPGVIAYSLSYACLKLVNNSFFFWLPYYLSNKFGWKDTVSDKISTFYDVGGIIGGIVGGLISDLIGKRTPLVVVMLVVSVPMLFIYGNTGGSYTLNAALMCITGFWIGGPSNLIGSAISADLGRQSALSADIEALATVTGILDGTGSVGAAIGQFLVPEINTHSGWKPVFYFLMVMAFMSFICLIIPPLIKFLRTRLYGENLPTYYRVIASDQPEYSAPRSMNPTLASS